LDSAMEAIVGDCSCDQEMRELRAENERLRASISRISQSCEKCKHDSDGAVTEIENEIDDLRAWSNETA
jgi:seryl-tRNA synthetase